MLWYGSYLVLWHLIGRCNPSQAARHRRALCGCSTELIDWWCGLREMIDWLRLVRWQTMQRLAHQGAALSVTIIPDCLAPSSPSPQPLSPTLPVHLSIPSVGSTHAVVYVHAQTQWYIYTNTVQTNHVHYSGTHTCTIGWAIWRKTNLKIFLTTYRVHIILSYPKPKTISGLMPQCRYNICTLPSPTFRHWFQNYRIQMFKSEIGLLPLLHC